MIGGVGGCQPCYSDSGKATSARMAPCLYPTSPEIGSSDSRHDGRFVSILDRKDDTNTPRRSIEEVETLFHVEYCIPEAITLPHPSIETKVRSLHLFRNCTTIHLEYKLSCHSISGFGTFLHSHHHWRTSVVATSDSLPIAASRSIGDVEEPLKVRETNSPTRHVSSQSSDLS